MSVFFKILFILLIFTFSLKADQFDQRLDILFDQLLEKDDDLEINLITKNIWKIWHETNDPKIEADFYRGLESLRTGDLIMSIAFFTRVIEKNPNFAEGWNKRATVYFMLGKFEKSLFDINQTLMLEPRHFGAMDGKGVILFHMGEYKKAIAVYEKILKIFPKSKATLDKKENMMKYFSQSI